MQDGIGGVHGGGARGGRAGAGADSGGARRGPRAAAVDGGGAGRRRRAGAGEPLPALPAAGAGGLRRDGVRGAHGPADHLRAQVQLHRGPADQAPGRQVGPRAPRPGILLRQRRRLAAGTTTTTHSIYCARNFGRFFPVHACTCTDGPHLRRSRLRMHACIATPDQRQESC